jgi:hypothetical protein
MLRRSVDGVIEVVYQFLVIDRADNIVRGQGDNTFVRLRQI